jgi:hypothetical protein
MADKAPPPAPTRPLGTTGMNITRVGVGTWAIGGPHWAFGWARRTMRYRSPPSCAGAWRELDRYRPWYGLGHAEEVVSRQNLALAEALKPVAGTLRDIPQADTPYVFTKCSLVWDESDHSVPPRRLGSRPLPRPRQQGTPNALSPQRASQPPSTARAWPVT